MLVFQFFIAFCLVSVSVYAQGSCGQVSRWASSFSNQTCAEAPTTALRTICENIKKIDNKSRQIYASSETKSGDLDCPPQYYDCMDLECLCRGYAEYKSTGPLNNGNCLLSSGQWMQKAVRKEYRTLSDLERQRFHSAVQKLKRNGIYNKLAKYHLDYAEGSLAHAGPGFLPWHREYLKHVEFELRRVDINVAIPYWDSTMDFLLPDPRDSIIWTPQFMGNTHDALHEGPFAGWNTVHGEPLKRAVGEDKNGRPFSHADIDEYLKLTDIDHALGLTAADPDCPNYKNTFNELETTHGYVHLWVGGAMHEIDTSANDPIFFLLHSFVDGVWEQWRRQHQSEYERRTAYPTNNEKCFNCFHFSGTVYVEDFRCSQVEKTNTFGLSNDYLNNLYEYDPRPACDTNCGNSPYLFCMKSVEKCASKLRPGGNCRGLENEDACYNGICVDGRCVEYDT